MSLKCEPALVEELRKVHPAMTPGYHLNWRHWNTAVLDGSLSEEVLGEMVEDSDDLVVGHMSGRARGRLTGASIPSRAHRHIGSEPVNLTAT